MTGKQVFDVAVIGGGILGLSIAERISRRDRFQVALLDKGVPGMEGATRASGGFLRLFHVNPQHTRMSVASRKRFDELKDEIEFHETGHLFVLPRNQLGAHAGQILFIEAAGYECRILAYEESHERFPALNLMPDEVAIYEPEAGYASPTAMAKYYRRQLASANALEIQNTEVLAMEPAADGLTMIHFHRGRLLARKVVLAMGAWNKPFLDRAGFRGRAENKRIELVEIGNPIPQMKEGFNHLPTGIYSRHKSERERFLGIPAPVFGIDPDEDGPFDAEGFGRMQGLVREVLPDFDLSRGFSGIRSSDSYTPGNAPTLEYIDPLHRWLLVSGLNGVGFKFHPVLAEMARNRLFQPF